MSILTGVIWCCITASFYVFDNMVLQIATTAILLLIGNLLISRLLVRPLAMLLAKPLDLLFPLKERPKI